MSNVLFSCLISIYVYANYFDEMYLWTVPLRRTINWYYIVNVTHLIHNTIKNNENQTESVLTCLSVSGFYESFSNYFPPLASLKYTHPRPPTRSLYALFGIFNFNCFGSRGRSCKSCGVVIIRVRHIYTHRVHKKAAICQIAF